MFPKTSKNKILLLLTVFALCLLSVFINSSAKVSANTENYNSNISSYNSNINNISVKLGYDGKIWEYKYPDIVYNGKCTSFDRDCDNKIFNSKNNYKKS